MNLIDNLFLFKYKCVRKNNIILQNKKPRKYDNLYPLLVLHIVGETRA